MSHFGRPGRSRVLYRAPVGQKVVQELPNIMRESMAIGQQWGQQLGSELHERMIEELRKKGHNI